MSSRTDPLSPNLTLSRWQPASWQDYMRARDTLTEDRLRLFFSQEHLLIDMGSEGINHASVSDLLPILFFLWFSKTQQRFKSYGRCLIEKPGQKAVSPDQVLYLGDNTPTGIQGDPRRINLQQTRLPDLVAEISDTTLATDLDEKKQLYADLGISEYWVIDVEGRQVSIFQLLSGGQYQISDRSSILNGLTQEILAAAIRRVIEESTDSAARWFQDQIS